MDQFSRDKSMFISIPLLMTQYMHYVQLVRGGGKAVKLLAVQDRVCRPAAIEQRHREVLVSVHDGLGEGEKGRNAAAPGHSDNVGRVPQRNIVKIALGSGHLHRRSSLPGIQDVPGNQPSFHTSRSEERRVGKECRL